MAHLVQLWETDRSVNDASGYSILNTYDLGNSTGSSVYNLVPPGHEKGEAQFKTQESDAPTVDSVRLMYYALKPRTDKITIDIIGASIDDLLAKKSALDAFFIKAMDAQVARNNGSKANWYYLAERPRNTSTKTYKSEIISGSVKLPPDALGANILSNIFENVVLTVRLHPYVSASVLTILSGVTANNGNGNYVDIGASGGTAITGDLPAPLSIAVAGGDTTTKRLLVALCQNGTPTNFKNIYWAKDATLTNNTASLTGNYTVTNAALTTNVATLTIGAHNHQVGDVVIVSGVSLSAVFNGTYTLTAIAGTTISYARTNANIGSAASSGTVTGEFDGSSSGNATRTTAADTSEHKTHQWVNSTNIGDQTHRLQGFARLRCNVAGRYSVRFRVGLTDGTNNFFPLTNAASDGFVTDAVQAVGTHSGNHLAWVPIGEFDLPPVKTFGANVYGIVIEMYVTCSNISGAPTLDADGLFVFPSGEGPAGTGLVQATYAFATGAAGISSALISAIPGDNKAALMNGSNVQTFPTMPDGGSGALFGAPLRAARLLFALVDSTDINNVHHDYTNQLTVTVIHELRNANLIGV